MNVAELLEKHTAQLAEVLLHEAIKEKGEAWAIPYKDWLQENCKDYLQAQ